MRRHGLKSLATGIALTAATAAQAYTPGALLIVEPGVGVRQWVPGAPTSTLVIPNPSARSVAIDAVGNAIVADPYGGVRRHSPSGVLLQTYAMDAEDVAVGPSGAIYVRRAFYDEIWRVDPPALVASAGIPGSIGLAATRDAGGGDLVLVTNYQNGGELLRVQPGPITSLATDLGDFISRPKLDRFGNVLVASDGRVRALDPATGAVRGTFTNASILNAAGATATSGDRYFVAVGPTGSDCEVFEIDPIFGSTTSWGVAPGCVHRPTAIAAVPGGTSAPKLSAGDLLLSDIGAFGGAGAILRLDPITGAPRLIATATGNVSVEIGPTREPTAVGTYPAGPGGIRRFAASTGKATTVASTPDHLMSAAYERTGDLALLARQSGVPSLMRFDRAGGGLTLLATLDEAWWAQWEELCYPWCPPPPVAIAVARRAAPGSPLADRALMTFQVPAFDAYGTPLVELAPSAPLVFGGGFVGGAPDQKLAVRPDGSTAWFVQSNRLHQAVPGGSVTPFTPPGAFVHPIQGIDVEDSGNVVLTSRETFFGVGAVFRVNAITGAITQHGLTWYVDPRSIAVVPPPSCSDGVDNDADGQIDFPTDTGCTSADDAWETADCNDGIDNDDDGAIDYAGGAGDPSCSSALVGIESTECSNGADDDGDGRIDGADAQCTGPTDRREAPNGCGLLGIEALAVMGWAAVRRRRSPRGTG